MALKEEEGGPLNSADLVRFKVQEIHTLNQFYQQYSRIEYQKSSRLQISKSIKNENLIELNVNAFCQTFADLSKDQIKDTIGNLNWGKFAERIQHQLKTNANLTATQK